MIKNVQELAGVRTDNGLRHQVLEGIVHGARFRVPGIEKHQHEIGQINDVIGDAQR